MLKLLFSFEGTIERQEYIKLMIAGWILGILTGPVSGLVPLLSIVTCVAAIWILFAAMIRRLRRVGMSPWKSLVLLVPLVNLIATIVLAFPVGNERGPASDTR